MGSMSTPGRLRSAHELRGEGVKLAVVSSSANCHRVLTAAKIDDLFDTVVDGGVAAR